MRRHTSPPVEIGEPEVQQHEVRRRRSRHRVGSGADPRGGEALQLELLQAQTASERTVVVVTHNREIARVADRVVQLSSGRVVSDGPPPGGKADVASLRW
jgi:ABC-type phosphate transport system ATPase subunit